MTCISLCWRPLTKVLASTAAVMATIKLKKRVEKSFLNHSDNCIYIFKMANGL